MRSVLTILRRDLGAYFTSPIGYIFMMVFVSISVGLMFTITFFVQPIADMRPFFGSLPILLCVFVPAVTMRLWAEERKENTWELLLTFPMKACELVIGKYFAALVFYCTALAATCTVPLMLSSLGNPDNGAVLAGYLGAVLLGAFFLAIGTFFSGFFKDQILAFVVTLLACIATFLVGNQFVQSYIDSAIPGLGTLLAELIGLSGHYDAFARGVIELADVLFFLAWIVVFLFLNIVFIDGRSRPRAKTYFAATVVICLSSGLLGNWLIADASLARFDVTENKLYTISDAAKNILADLTAPVQIQYYVSPKNDMPTLMNTIEQDITDKLDELRVASNGKVEFKVIHLSASNFIDTQPTLQQQEVPENEDAALEARMKDKGIAPFSVQAMSDDQFTSMFVYSTIGIAYKDKKEELIPQIIPQRLPGIEYTLMNTIYKVAREKAPIVALVAPVQTISPQMQMMYMQRGMQPPPPDDPYQGLQQLLTYEKYDVRRVELTQSSPLPAEYDTLVVVGPRNLNARQKWEINRAIVQGKSVLLAVQNYQWDYQSTQAGGTTINQQPQTPAINDLLQVYGFSIDEDFLMDRNTFPLTVQSQANTLASLFGGGQQFDLPTHMQVTNDAMNEDTSITGRLAQIFYLWGTAVKFDDTKLSENQLATTTLISSTNQAWTVPAAALTQDSLTPPDATRTPLTLMAMVTGQFPDAYPDAARPAWPPPPPQMPGQPPQPPPAPEMDTPAPIVPAPGKMIVAGCAMMFNRNFFREDHIELFLNSVDAVTLGDDLVNVRGRKPINRLISRPDDKTRRKWKFINYFLANLIIAGAGITTAVVRRSARNAYTLRFTQGD